MRGGTRTNILLKRRTKNNPRIVLLWLWFVLENIRLYVFALSLCCRRSLPKGVVGGERFYSVSDFSKVGDRKESSVHS